MNKYNNIEHSYSSIKKRYKEGDSAPDESFSCDWLAVITFVFVFAAVASVASVVVWKIGVI